MSRILPAAADIRVMRSSAERMGVLYRNFPCDQNQIHVIFCYHLQRFCNVEHACLGNLPGTTPEWLAHYNLQLIHDKNVDSFSV
ncbi:hypothetical protein TNCV_4162001 [Trichonephila clavipes]|nr:hypothetical protein TNCV_4162001 [Trichonephila clavipes]